jgi:hypothetical protein
MLSPCEVAVKSVLPATRAFISKELIHSYNMKQSDVANLLGITQAAVSKYVRQVRGTAILIDQILEIRALMQNIAQQLAEKQLAGSAFYIQLCEVCKVVRRKGLMCPLCKRSDPALDIKHCNVCNSRKSNCRA